MYWKIFAKRIEDTPEIIEGIPFIEHEALIELSWGWTAGMTQDDMKNIAEDCPTGHDSIVTTLSLIKQLRDDLNLIIEEAENNPPILDPRQIEKEKEMEEKITKSLEKFLARKYTNNK